MASIRENILGRPKREPVTVEAWGQTLYIHRMSNQGRDRYEVSITPQKGGSENFRAKMLVQCLYDDQGNRVFSDSDVVTLGDMDFDNDISLLFDKAWEVNALTATSVEVAAKNSSSETAG